MELQNLPEGTSCSEQEEGGTHRQHGVEEVGDEGRPLLDGLLSLGQVGFGVTLKVEAPE